MLSLLYRARSSIKHFAVSNISSNRTNDNNRSYAYKTSIKRDIVKHCSGNCRRSPMCVLLVYYLCTIFYRILSCVLKSRGQLRRNEKDRQ